jgi:hypothetical protein
MLTRVNPVLPPEIEEIATRTIGCAVRVHREFGPGYVEAIYQDALRIELELELIPFEYEVPVIFVVAFSSRCAAVTLALCPGHLVCAESNVPKTV